MDKYFGFWESNGHEGEEWTIYFPVLGNEQFIEWFSNLEGENHPDSETEFDIEAPDEWLERAEVDLLVRRARGSYAPSDQLCDQIINLEELKTALALKIESEEPYSSEREAFYDLIYKMQIRDYLKEV